MIYEHMLIKGLLPISLKHQNTHVSLFSIFYKKEKDISLKL